MKINMLELVVIVEMGKYLAENKVVSKEIIEKVINEISKEQNLPKIYF